MIFDQKKIRQDFPILKRKINNHPLIYFDSAASSQKPNMVIEAEKKFYEKDYSAINRGIHTLSTKATFFIEEIRKKVAKFINAYSEKEIIFVKSTTEGINLIASCFSNFFLKKGDNIIITQMEHHSNIVPWQILCNKISIEIRILPITKKGELDLNILPSLLDKKTRMMCFLHVSNVLGTINPVRKIIQKVKKLGIITVVDGAQAIMHEKVDVQNIKCDFYIFSGHKMYGPTGIGILYGKKNLLKKMPPYQGGGSMISYVNLYKTPQFLEIPWKFEAGTINSAGIVGLGAAMQYIESIGLKNIKKYEQKLINYALKKLMFIPNLTIYGNSKLRTGVISFNIEKYNSYDIGNFLDQYGIAIRTGHQCAIPIMEFYHVAGMCRISFSVYNNKKEIDYLISTLLHISNLLKH